MPNTGGSYVPPHKRNAKEGGEPAATSPPQPPHHPTQNHNKSRNNNSNSNSRNNSPKRNNNNNRNNSPKRNNNKSPKGNSNHNSNQNNRKSKSPTRQNHHHHHVHLDKEQLHHQQEQLKKLKDSVTRICCINLERRPDRWKSFQQHLHQSLGRKIGHSLLQKIERFNAVDGIPATPAAVTQVTTTWDASINAKWDRHISPPMTKTMGAGEVGCALSHVKLWQELAAMTRTTSVGNSEEEDTAELQEQQERMTTMLILEDDALFYSPRMAHVGETPPPAAKNDRDKSPKGERGGINKQDHHHPSPPPLIIANHDFLTAYHLAWTQLPEDWDIWYLGFSDRGDRLPVENDFHVPRPHHHDHHKTTVPSLQIRMFRPTYGFHTHGYVLNVRAAQTLTNNLPVQGPLDVWLADNQWFGLNVYCSVIANEGWHNTGAWLITQNRKPINPNKNNGNNNAAGDGAGVPDSDIPQSGRN